MEIMEVEDGFEAGWVLQLDGGKGIFFAERGAAQVTLNTENVNQEKMMILIESIGGPVQIKPKTGEFRMATPISRPN